MAASLLYGRQYDDHPALQAVLTQFRSKKTSLIDAYTTIGDDVWREVSETARQRAEEAAVQAHQAKLREYGAATMRVKIVNDTRTPRRRIELQSTIGLSTSTSSLGDIDDRGGEPAQTEIASARVPIPGTRATVRWIEPMGESCDEVTVTGELPRAEGEGLAIVEFARNWFIYVHMYAEEPPKARQW